MQRQILAEISGHIIRWMEQNRIEISKEVTGYVEKEMRYNFQLNWGRFREQILRFNIQKPEINEKGV